MACPYRVQSTNPVGHCCPLQGCTALRMLSGWCMCAMAGSKSCRSRAAQRNLQACFSNAFIAQGMGKHLYMVQGRLLSHVVLSHVHNGSKHAWVSATATWTPSRYYNHNAMTGWHPRVTAAKAAMRLRHGSAQGAVAGHIRQQHARSLTCSDAFSGFKLYNDVGSLVQPGLFQRWLTHGDTFDAADAWRSRNKHNLCHHNDRHEWSCAILCLFDRKFVGFGHVRTSGVSR